MSTSGARIGIVGGVGTVWEDFGRLMAVDVISCAGCCDARPEMAKVLVDQFPSTPIAVYDDFSTLIRQGAPDALIIATSDRSHYRAAMEGLQAGCHLLLWETPLSTNVQEVVDIVGLARARDRKVCLTHQYRHLSTMVRAREMLAKSLIGRVRLVASTLAVQGPTPNDGWLAQLGVDWVDSILQLSLGTVEMVSATRAIDSNGVELTSLASLKLAGGALVSMAMIAGVDRPAFDLNIVGETGRLIVTDNTLTLMGGQGEGRVETPTPVVSDCLSNFVAVIREGVAPLCPASEAVDAVRVMEAIVRSAAIGQFVGLA